MTEPHELSPIRDLPPLRPLARAAFARLSYELSKLPLPDEYRTDWAQDCAYRFHVRRAMHELNLLDQIFIELKIKE